VSRPPTPEMIFDAAVALADERARHEAELVAELYHSPARTWPVAVAAGFSVALLRQPDLRAIGIAVEVCATTGADTQTMHAALARFLRAEGYWHDGPAAAWPASGGIWDEAKLRRLAGARYYSSSAIRYHVRHLIEIDARQQQARRHWRDAHRLLTGELEPDLPAAGRIRRVA